MTPKRRRQQGMGYTYGSEDLMTTATLTLSDFLLARIAEDEADARRPAGVLRMMQSRVLVECKAKRLLHRWHSRWHICEDAGAGEYGPDGAPDGHVPCDVLRVISLPYADHPDYRPEWRP